MVTEWFSTGRFKQFHGVDSSDPEAYYKMLGVYARNMADHRQNVFRVAPELIAATRHSDGKLTLRLLPLRQMVRGLLEHGADEPAGDRLRRPVPRGRLGQ